MSAIDLIKAMRELKNDDCLDESMIYCGGGSSESQRYYNAKPAGMFEDINDLDIQFKKGIKNRYSFKAYLDGTLVAYGELQKTDDSASVQDIVVSEKYRRRGIATKIYDEIEKQLGLKLSPSDDLTDLGGKFWVNRNTRNMLEDENYDDDVIYYFAYGMLTDPDYMGNAELVGVGKLSNYKLTLYTYANVEPDSDNDVYGCLWAIDKPLLSSLDDIEGYPTLYTRELHNVFCKGRNYKAEVYVMTDNTLRQVQDTVPSQGYVDTIVNGYRHGNVPLDQLRVAVDEVNNRYLNEASPDTLGGSFTDDLIESKSWLCEILSKGLKGKNTGTIYVIGSWYGNLGIYLQQYDIKFDRLVFIDTDENNLQASKKLLEPLYDEGKLILLHQNADDVVYDKPGIVINTSCNETGPVFLTKLPDDMLVVLQSRNNNGKELMSTDSLEELTEYFPLKKIYYSGEKHLTDPETEYDRFMIIGRSGKKLDETVSTGLGGGSAGNNGGSMVGGPETYEQEYDMFKSHGQRRIRVNFESKEVIKELFDKGYDYTQNNVSDNLTVYRFMTAKGKLYKIRIFKNPSTGYINVEFAGQYGEIGITNTRDEFRILATVVGAIEDYVKTHSDVNTILFRGDTNEPSRIKLYTTMARTLANKLIGFDLADIIPNRNLTTFVVKKRDSQRKNTVESLTQKKISLDQLYKGSYPEHDEMIWNYAGRNDFDIPFTVETISPAKLSLFLTFQYQVETLRDLYDMMDKDQRLILQNYSKDPNLSNEIIVMHDGKIIDGNHRALAAALAKKPIRYIDIAEKALNEIDGAHETGKINWDPSYKDQAEIIGQTEGFDIYKMPVGNNVMFMILGSGDELSAYIIAGRSKNFPDRLAIHQIENLSGKGGMATTLAVGLRSLGVKLAIDSDEPLTPSGLKWVISLIHKKYAAFDITDQNGDPIDPDVLTRERENAILNKKAGPTSIIIEFNEFIMDKLTENNKQWLKEGIEGLLKPCYVFLGAGYFL